MTEVIGSGFGFPTLPRGSLAEIEVEVSNILATLENVQRDRVHDSIADCQDDSIWQIAEAVRGLAWAVASLALHHADAQVHSVVTDAEPVLRTVSGQRIV